ncbi:hypothetical protein M569_05670 [Genlisea aurea]|uniref:C2H2-type domain-containing protein n=1 Tax=Genlisea aurea TaxID=192259 RepID=S8E9D6_9LAMI|nr:hypothetical protein M569_05670 [Genlisea aurea]
MGGRNSDEWNFPAEPRCYVCDHCGRSFKCGKSLGGHVSSGHARATKIGHGHANDGNSSAATHSGAGEFQCKNCPRRFTSKKSMYGHQRIHSKNKCIENDVVVVPEVDAAGAGEKYSGVDARDIYAALKLLEIKRFALETPPANSTATATKRPLENEDGCSATTTADGEDDDDDDDDDDYISEFESRAKAHEPRREALPENISGGGGPEVKFYCKICHEGFGSPQAVGGHMSRHRQRPSEEESEMKVKIKIKFNGK